MRQRVREEGLCGYQVPEIDYSSALHLREFAELSLDRVRVLPHDYLGFLRAHQSALVAKTLYHPLYLLSNLTLHLLPLPLKTKERLAHTLIVTGQKRQRAA